MGAVSRFDREIRFLPIPGLLGHSNYMARRHRTRHGAHLIPCKIQKFLRLRQHAARSPATLENRREDLRASRKTTRKRVLRASFVLHHKALQKRTFSSELV